MLSYCVLLVRDALVISKPQMEGINHKERMDHKEGCQDCKGFLRSPKGGAQPFRIFVILPSENLRGSADNSQLRFTTAFRDSCRTGGAP